MEALFCAFVLLQVVVELDQEHECGEIGAVRFQQSFETIAGFLILTGLNEFADGLKVIFLINVSTFKAKRCLLGE
jgi:hypothetical protein